MMDKSKDPYITVTSGMSGYFAVHVWWNDDDGGFWEPFSTGTGRYKDFKEAEAEAIGWAEADGMDYRAPDIAAL